MEINIIKAGTGAAEITVRGSKMLAVLTNLNSKIYKQVSRKELLSESGIILEDEQTKKWECTDSFEHEGKLIFPGPFFDGNTLADQDMDIGNILKLAEAFQEIMKENFPMEGYYPPGVFSISGGSLLFFPPLLIKYVINQLSDESNLKYWQIYNHPDAHGEHKFTFTIAALVYKLLTGSMPYEGSTITEIREKMRISKPVKIDLLVPGIKEDIAELINKALNLKDTKLQDWIGQLKLWGIEGVQTFIDKKGILDLQKTAEKKQKKREKDFIRRQFFSHNWKTIGIITIAFAIILSFSLGPIKKSLEPPITLGLSPLQVVELYYKSYNEMDVETMEVCVKRGIGKNDINEITQIYVISKVRTGYEGKSGLISAQDWSDGLLTEISEGEQIAGIANLKIKNLGNLIFQADYTRWFVESPTDNNSTEFLKPKEIIYTDTLTINKIKDVWEIVKLERITKE